MGINEHINIKDILIGNYLECPKTDCRNYIAILIDIDFKKCIINQYIIDQYIKPLHEFGCLFIWCEPEFIMYVVEILERFHYQLVETFTLVYKNLSNKIINIPNKYFNNTLFQTN